MGRRILGAADKPKAPLPEWFGPLMFFTVVGTIYYFTIVPLAQKNLPPELAR